MNETPSKPSNPNGANQTTPDPREQVCWDLYVKSIDEGRENAMQAAIEAGYEEATAKNVTLRGWFKERKETLRRKGFLSKAERNLEKVLDLKTDKDGVENPQLLKIQTDTSLNIAKTLGKNEGYSERTEVVGKDGEPLMQAPFSNPKLQEALKPYEDKLIELIAHEATNPEETVETEAS